MDSLRIGLIAPPWFSIPPRGYGGIEWVVSNLAEGLVERGHRVTLFASGGSETGAKLVSTYEEPPSEDLGDCYVEAPALIDAYRSWRDFDVIHDHTMLGLIAGAAVPTPVVHTIHGQILPKFARFYAHVAGRVHLVAISGNQASTLPEGCGSTVIHNGIRLDRFPFEPASGGDYLLFVGRMSPEKGILRAVEIAKRSGRRLVVLAKINETPESEYFESVVRPALRDIPHELLQQPPHEEKVAAYQGALATLFPIEWPEPFGLVMTESMACGTPVIAFARGAAPEVIENGKTGFLCEDIGEAVHAVERVSQLRRADCRRHVEEFFSAELNVARHEALYRRVAGRAEAHEPVAQRGRGAIPLATAASVSPAG